MPQETIRALATEIVNQTILNNWFFYVVLACITVILSAAGAFLSSYLSKRAERLALTADFAEIKRQLQESTSITELIKADIQRLSQRSEKLEWLKREKLENYIVAVLRGVEHLSKIMNHHYFGVELLAEDDPLMSASMLQKLYLPELDLQHAALLLAVADFRSWTGTGMQMQVDAMKAGKGKQPPSEEHLDFYSGHLTRLNAAVIVIEEKAKEVARQINKI